MASKKEKTLEPISVRLRTIQQIKENSNILLAQSINENNMKVYYAEDSSITEPTMVVYIPSSFSIVTDMPRQLKK